MLRDLTGFEPEVFIRRFWSILRPVKAQAEIDIELRASWQHCLHPERLLSSFPNLVGIQAWSPSGSQHCGPHEALKFYLDGAALYIPKVQNLCYGAETILKSLESDLGVPAGSGHCSVFCGSRGSVVSPHCDHDYGFNYLVYGAKRWRISVSENLEFPLVGHQIGRQASSRISGLVPDCMPPYIGFIQESGDCVFVPPGVWHSTECLVESLSLDFAIDPPRRSDFLLNELRCDLESVVEFRTPLDKDSLSWIENRGLPLLRKFRRNLGPAIENVRSLIGIDFHLIAVLKTTGNSVCYFSLLEGPPIVIEAPHDRVQAVLASVSGLAKENCTLEFVMTSLSSIG